MAWWLRAFGGWTTPIPPSYLPTYPTTIAHPQTHTTTPCYNTIPHSGCAVCCALCDQSHNAVHTYTPVCGCVYAVGEVWSRNCGMGLWPSASSTATRSTTQSTEAQHSTAHSTQHTAHIQGVVGVVWQCSMGLKRQGVIAARGWSMGCWGTPVSAQPSSTAQHSTGKVGVFRYWGCDVGSAVFGHAVWAPLLSGHCARWGRGCGGRVGGGGGGGLRPN